MKELEGYAAHKNPWVWGWSLTLQRSPAILCANSRFRFQQEEKIAYSTYTNYTGVVVILKETKGSFPCKKEESILALSREQGCPAPNRGQQIPLLNPGESFQDTANMGLKQLILTSLLQTATPNHGEPRAKVLGV